MSYQIGKNIRLQNKLKDEIYKRGYTIKEFADRVQINRLTMNYWFRGQQKPSRYCIQVMADELNMPYKKVERLCTNR